MKKILRDPSMWVLLATNIFILQHYFDSPDSINSVILLFWIQSVLIGLFNALDIFTVTNIVDVNDMPAKSIGIDKTLTGSFFLFHFGLFHIVYLVFLRVQVLDMNKLDWDFIRLSGMFMVATSVLGFIQHKLRNRTNAVHLGNMFLLPYARILPMHFIVLIPAFFSVPASVTFIILKIIADIIMYIIYQNSVFKPMNSVEN